MWNLSSASGGPFTAPAGALSLCSKGSWEPAALLHPCLPLWGCPILPHQILEAARLGQWPPWSPNFYSSSLSLPRAGKWPLDIIGVLQSQFSDFLIRGQTNVHSSYSVGIIKWWMDNYNFYFSVLPFMIEIIYIFWNIVLWYYAF